MLQQRQPQFTPNRFFDPNSDFAPQASPPAQPAPQPGDIAKATDPSAPPQSPAQQFFSGPNPAPPAAPPSPVPSYDQWHQQHGDAPVAGPPQVPHHGKIASIMMGIGEALGNPLATRLGQRDRELQQNYNDYERELPATQYKANRAGYEEDIGNQEKASTINRNNFDMGRAQATAKQNAISQILEEKESGKYPDDILKQRWQRIAQANPTLGMVQSDIDNAIAGTKPLGSKYTLTRDPQTEAPIELVDRQGNHFSKSNLPQDPEAQQMWNDADTASTQKLTNEENKEKRVAGFAADRQAQGFVHADQARTATENFQNQEKGKAEAAKHLQALREAQNQNELVQQLASSKSPTDQTSLAFKALGLDLPDGVHRINETELNAIANQGSLSDRARKAILGWTTGQKFAPNILEDIKQTANKIAASKMKTANDNLEDVNRNYGYRVYGADERGRFDGTTQASGSSTQHKVGDVVSLGGQKIKISAIHADGTFDGDPVP